MDGRFVWQRQQTGWQARYELRTAEGRSEVWAVKRNTGESARDWRGTLGPHQEYFGWAYRAAGDDDKTVERQVAEAATEWFRGYSARAEADAALLRRRRREPEQPLQERARVYYHAKEAMRAAETVIVARRLRQASLPVLPLCLVCRHLQWSNAEPGYSEYTPGSDLSVGCGKSYWTFDNETTMPADWARMITTAEHCNDFDPTQQIRRGAMVVPANTTEEPSRGRRAYDLDGDPNA